MVQTVDAAPADHLEYPGFWRRWFYSTSHCSSAAGLWSKHSVSLDDAAVLPRTLKPLLKARWLGCSSLISGLWLDGPQGPKQAPPSESNSNINASK
jgi:hypothetical protein